MLFSQLFENLFQAFGGAGSEGLAQPERCIGGIPGCIRVHNYCNSSASLVQWRQPHSTILPACSIVNSVSEMGCIPQLRWESEGADFMPTVAGIV